jgi:hypothetical protein
LKIGNNCFTNGRCEYYFKSALHSHHVCKNGSNNSEEFGDGFQLDIGSKYSYQSFIDRDLKDWQERSVLEI